MGSFAFRNCSNLSSVRIPNSVTSIGTEAFRGCSDLISVEISNAVPSVGDYVFADCPRIRNVFVNWTTPILLGGTVFYNRNLSDITLYVPDGTKTAYQAAPSWKGFGTIIERGNVSGNGDFEIINGVLVRYRGAGEDVVIPDEVTGIGQGAFAGCSSLTSVEIPAPVTNIVDAAFAGCTGLSAIHVDPANNDYTSEDGVLYSKDKTKLHTCPAGTGGAFSIPGSVTDIAAGAFYGCVDLTSVEIPGSVASIGRSAFSGCTNLSAINVAPANSSYTSVDGVLYNKNKTALLVYPSGKGGVFSIPGSVTSIGDSAFYDCSGLVSVEIPNTVTKIGTSAFRGCSGLTSREIPGSVTGIGDFVFAYCSGLRHVFVNRTTPVSVGGSVFNNGINPQNLTLYVPSGAKAAYQAAPVWQDFGTIM
ncbi:MAG: leucine-rich repeat domain-containing protein, partial [Tannerella sp.]|nr:leucine-rich repeat domain-containing protein [Tannerella sp.]